MSTKWRRNWYRNWATTCAFTREFARNTLPELCRNEAGNVFWIGTSFSGTFLFFYSIQQLNEIDLNHLDIYLLRGTLSITITAYHLSHSNFCTNYIRVRTCVPLYFSNLPSSNTPFIFLLYILYIRIKFRRKI